MRVQHLCIGALSVAMSTAAVNAMLPPPGVVAVNVNFASTLKLDGTAWDPTVAPLHYTGNRWTDSPLPQSYPPDRSASMSASNLVASDDSPTTISYALTGIYNGSGMGPSSTTMLSDFIYAGAGSPTVLTLSGLDDASQYNVDIASGAAGLGGGVFTIGGTTLTSSGTNLTSWTEGEDYLHFANVSPSGGQIVVNTGNGGNYSFMNGFQIAAVPEPASLATLGLGGVAMAMLRRRRAK